MENIIQLTIVCITTLWIWKPVSGGTCWSGQTPNGFCQGFIKDGVTMTECCRMSLGQAGYTDKDITKSDKVFYYMFINPPLCQPCSGELPSRKPLLVASKALDPCKSIYCGKNRRCKLDAFLQPRCICTPDCSKTYSGDVCGSDSKTYNNECELLKSRCRQREDFKVDYYHKCQASCSTVKCPAGKRCIVDQYKVPHCIERVCPSTCIRKGGKETVCGTNGKTYVSFCHLRKEACATGLSIGMAHKGKCEDTTCTTYKCPKHKKCLTDKNKRIRCVACKKFCFEGLYSYRPVCGSDNRTYKNWCMLRQAACDSEIFIDVMHQGNCR